MAKFRKPLRKEFKDLSEEQSYLEGVIGSMKDPKTCDGEIPEPYFFTELLNPFRCTETWKIAQGEDGVGIKKPYGKWEYYKFPQFNYVTDLIEAINSYNDRVTEALNEVRDVRDRLKGFVPEGVSISTSIGTGNGNIEIYVELEGFKESFRYLNDELAKESISEITDDLKSKCIKRDRVNARNEAFMTEFNALLKRYNAKIRVDTWEEGTLYADFEDEMNGNVVLQEF